MPSHLLVAVCRGVAVAVASETVLAWVSDSVQRRSIFRRCPQGRSRPFRPRRSFRCRSTLPCEIDSRSGRVGGAGGCPTIRAGIVSPAGVQTAAAEVICRPRRSFHCRSTLPCDRLGQRARWWCWWLSNCRCWDCIFRRCQNGWCSNFGASAPDDHFAAGPHCRVTASASGRVSGAGGCPTVRCWDCISRRC